MWLTEQRHIYTDKGTLVFTCGDRLCTIYVYDILGHTRDHLIINMNDEMINEFY